MRVNKPELPGSAADPAAAVEWQALPAVAAIQKRAVRMLMIAQVIGGVGIGAAASLGALLAESVTGTEELAGVARTCTTLGAAGVALPLALLASRYGRNRALGLGWALAAFGGIGLVASAATGNFLLLITGMLLFGCGSAVNLQSRYAAIDLARPAHRSRTLSIVVWSTTVGSVVGPNLSAPGATFADWFGLPPLSGGFLISSVVLVLGAAAMFLMRPDPLLTAQRYSGARSAGSPSRRHSLSSGMQAIRSHPAARFALCSIVLGHTVMAAVMTMTPVHMMGYDAGLALVGMTLSLHVAGMYAFSPVVGWISDRIGRISTIMIGQLLFLVAALLTGMAGTSTPAVTVGLFLLGLGWSCSLVAGSTLLAESLPESVRPAAQGISDTAMNLVAAAAAGGSGYLQQWVGFSGLNVCAGLLTIPIIVLFLRGRRRHR